MVRRFSGATIRRVIDASNSEVAEHAHDWPVLSLFVMGRYRNDTEVGQSTIQGPSALFYRARAAHRNVVGPLGFEQIEIEFDAAWLGEGFLPARAVSRWLDGRSGVEARELARVCALAPNELRLRTAIRRFVRSAQSRPTILPPPWLHAVQQCLADDTNLGVADLAREAKRHPSWLGTAYRRATGEGLMETAARYRAERAACALRESGRSYARIAQESGFCDQSHMNRTLQRVLGRTPSQLRNDRSDDRGMPLNR